MIHRLERIRDLSDKLDAFSAMVHEALDGIPDLVCLWSGRRIRFANQAFFTLLGLTREDVTDALWREFVHPDDVEATVKATERGEQIVGLENRWRTAQGGYVRISWCSTAPSAAGTALAIGTVMEPPAGRENDE